MTEDRPQQASSGSTGGLRRLFRPIDIASLVYFRIVFGAIMLWEVYRYLSLGRVEAYYLTPEFHFTYLGFGWVQPWPGDGMFIHFYVMGVLAAFITVGFLYRLSAALFFLAFTYVFLLEQAQYLNHFYFVSLVSFLMIFVPAHRALSVDGWIRGPAWRSQTAPAWSLWILRAEMGFVYFFAGVAKLNMDWLQGYPLRSWILDAEVPAIVTPYMSEVWLAVGMSWAGMLLDLFIVPALLWRRTRPWAFAAALAFHLMNAVLFSIGIFPWFSIGATLLFFDPDWPRRLLRLGRGPVGVNAPSVLGAREKATAAFVLGFVALQIAIPLRPFLYPGNPSWTEDGHRFSWHQKLRSKNGYVRFLLTDPSTGRTWKVDPTPLLTQRQYRKMAERPYMILQLAHHLADLATEEGKPRVEVRAAAIASLNGREMQPITDQTVDLAAEPRRAFTPYPWILPLEVPLEAQWDGKSPPKHPATLAAIERQRERVQAYRANRAKSASR
jgi:vitamin K-dependent gamma-carboxylase